MNILRNILICTSSATLLLTVLACNKTELYTRESELSINTLSESSTKSVIVPFPNDTFGLFANATSDPAGTPAERAWKNSLFFDSQSPEFPEGHPDALYINNGCFSNQVTAGNGTYVGANPNNIGQHHPYYWPNGGSLILAAYSPHIDQSDGIITSITYENTTIADRMGLMTIKVVLEQEAAGIALNPAESMSFDLLHCRPIVEDQNDKTHGRQQTAVLLHFKHAMSKLTFVINNPQGKYKLTEAKLQNCVNSALFFSGITNNTGWLPNFQDKEQKKLMLDYDLLATPQIPDNDSYTIDLIVIPHQLNGIYETVSGNFDQPVILSLGISNTDDVGKTTQTFDLSQLPDPAPKVWKGGMHYTYNITVNAHKIEFGKPSIDPWTDTNVDI